MKTRFTLRALLPVVLTAAGCASILGIEDIHEDEKPGTDDGNESGSGGTNAGRGGSSATGGSGTGGRGGTSGTSGTAGSTTGGTAGTAGAAGGGGGEETGGTGGSGEPPDDTVRGRVITTWMQPVPNIVVMIGDAEATTNADGEFEIPDVAETYDAMFVVVASVYGDDRTYGWVYEGLTRRDPTLQVYDALIWREAAVLMEPDPDTLTTMDFTNRLFKVALGGTYGATSFEVDEAGSNGTAGWSGPAMTNVTGHGLLYEHVDDIPTVYRSYDQQFAVLSETAGTTITFDVPDESVGSGTVSGSVTSPTSDERNNYVHLRFESNASMLLVDHYGSTLDPASFTYVVPSVPGGSIEVVALEGYWGTGAGIAHRDRLAPGQMGVALEIPDWPQLVAPVPDVTGVDETTIFSWTSTAQTFVWNADNIDLNGPYNGIYVVTTAKRVTIPEFPNGFTLVPNNLYAWHVEVHNDAATVDELAGPQGFADSYAPYGDAPYSPRRGDGTFATSGGRRFYTAVAP